MTNEHHGSARSAVQAGNNGQPLLRSRQAREEPLRAPSETPSRAGVKLLVDRRSVNRGLHEALERTADGDGPR